MIKHSMHSISKLDQNHYLTDPTTRHSKHIEQLCAIFVIVLVTQLLNAAELCLRQQHKRIYHPRHVFRGRVRTYDLPLRKRPLYPLSYTERMQTFYV